ncbi:MAG: aspartate/glutamate racemase family protein [Acidobacteria bacterium]|nr:aspartate/glutamate racemase family protein [Acidobacteriota bacterium]
MATATDAEDSMTERRFRVGLMVPSSNTSMEPDFHRQLDRMCTISTGRMFLDDVTVDAEELMLAEELPRSARALKSGDPQVIVFGCTSAGSLLGLEHDRGIARRITDLTGVPSVTVLGAVVAQLRAKAALRVAVFTPYNHDLSCSVARCVAEAGYELVKTEGLGIVSNRVIGEMPPSAIVEFVESHMAGVCADAMFLSCTNWRAIEAIAPLEARFGVPVVTSNHATIEAVRQLAANAGMLPSCPD